MKHISQSEELDRKSKLENLKQIGRVQKQPNKRKRRYINAESECKFCGESIPLHQNNHLLQFCRGIQATPVVAEDITDYAALARRAFAIGQQRLVSNNVQLMGTTTPTRSTGTTWGDRPGQSLSELQPRRKRTRLNFQNRFQN